MSYLEFEYGTTFYGSKSLKEHALEYLKVLPKNINTLISSGSSGCSIASAMLLLSKRNLNHLYIPKKHENRHLKSNNVGNMLYTENMAIVDDFIATGKTIMFIMKSISIKYRKNVRCIIVRSGHINSYYKNKNKVIYNKIENRVIRLVNYWNNNNFYRGINFSDGVDI